MEKIKINIYGGGISGLITAFELCKYNEFDITIYEKSDSAGGMAKSKYINGIPSEHSWRAYGQFYYNLINVLKQIPIKSICNNLQEGGKILKYSIKEVSKHNNINDLWCYYKNNVYDLTDFVNNHPGGSIIVKCAGKNLEQVWNDYGYEWHNSNSNVIDILDKYKIGELIDKDKTKNLKNYKINHNHNHNHNHNEHFKNNYTAFDNLKLIEFDLLFNNIKKKDYGQLSNLPKLDLIYLGFLFLKTNFINKRNKDYYKIKFKDFINTTIVSNETNYYFRFLTGPGFGLDLNTASFNHMAKFIMLQSQIGFKSWFITNKPTNESWINPLLEYLINNNVKINFNSEVNKINFNNNKIINCLVNDNNVESDIHIFSLDPFNYEKLLLSSSINNNDYLYLNTINNQIGFRLGFKKKIKFGNKPIGYSLIDSPFEITFYNQTDSWCSNINLKNNIKTLISGTIITPFNKGLLYKKSGTKHTIEELKQEIISQFMNSNEFLKIVYNNNNKYNILKEDFIYVEIYDDWYYDQESNMLKTKNKKWVNNIINEEYRPKNNYTQFDNAYIAGSHMKTSVDIWCMESATESGKLCANIILKKYNKPLCFYHDHNKKNILSQLLTILDDILYDLNLPHILDCVIILSIILLVLKLFQKI